MSQRNWIILVVVVVILVVGYNFWRNSQVGTAPDTGVTTEPAEETTE